jgi:hypothetical protein
MFGELLRTDLNESSRHVNSMVWGRVSTFIEHEVREQVVVHNLSVWQNHKE